MILIGGTCISSVTRQERDLPQTPDRNSLDRRTFLRGAGTAIGLGTAGCTSGLPVLGGRQRYPAPAAVDSPPRLRPHPDVENTVLTGDAVSDRMFTEYVADPFVAFDGDTYHLFFEVFYTESPQPPVTADIGHAVSDDGLNWEYDQIALDDPYHLAYPHVFQWDGEWYMTPDKATYKYGGIPEFRIYRGDPFPTNWTLEKRSGINEHFGDPTPVRVDGRWYLFSVEQEGVQGTRLHYADSLLADEWTEHPASPVFEAARNFRPAGRPVVYDDHLHLFIQDVERTYGDKVRCYRVETLTEAEYEHTEIEGSPVIEATRDGGWNDDGMHHVDAALAYDDTKNVVAVDGKDPDGRWSIGLYELVTDES